METNKLHRGRLIDPIQLVVRGPSASRAFYAAVLDELNAPIGGDADADRSAASVRIVLLA